MAAHDPDGGEPVTGGTPAAGVVPEHDSPYWTFYEEVGARQVAAWALPSASRVLDLSGGHRRCAAQLLADGHEVVHVTSGPSCPAPRDAGPGRLRCVRADGRAVPWLADRSVDAVLTQAPSQCLATELVAEDLVRVLRPGGRLLLVVESLALGLARLAEQGRWAELADAPSADVLLVPGTDGRLTRCFSPDELETLLAAAGLLVEWVRPRTVLTPAAVERTLEQGGRGTLHRLVDTEMELAEGHPGEAAALHLVASARRPQT